MKNLLFIIGIALLSSCSLFKKSVETESTLDSLVKKKVETTNVKIDTTRSTYTERYRLTMPTVGLSFPMANFQIGSLVDATKDLKANTGNLLGQTSNPNLYKLAYDDALGNFILEWEKITDLKNGKSESATNKSTEDTSVKKDNAAKSKDAINPWLAAGLAAMTIIAVFLFFKK